MNLTMSIDFLGYGPDPKTAARRSQHGTSPPQPLKASSVIAQLGDIGNVGPYIANI